MLVATNLGGESLIVQKENTAGGFSLLPGLDARLVADKGAQPLQIPSTLVIGRGVARAIEPLERGEALDAKPLSQRLLGVGVDLCDLDLVLGELKDAGELLVDGGEVLAVAAPGCEELDERGLSGLEDDVVEVVGDQVDDGRLGGDCCRQAGEHEAFEEHCGGWEVQGFCARLETDQSVAGWRLVSMDNIQFSRNWWERDEMEAAGEARAGRCHSCCRNDVRHLASARGGGVAHVSNFNLESESLHLTIGYDRHQRLITTV